MADIYHQVGVNVNLSSAYQAISTIDGLSHWWTNTTGNTDVGDKLHFHFGEHHIEMTILELIPNEKAAWQCTEKEGEWKDTIITFDFVDTDKQVFINFSHTKWSAQTDLCSHCSTKWAIFMLSLKQYLETGTGKPFPDDIQINHLDF